MPTYDYRCAGVEAVYSVRHKMSEKAYTWGELCVLGNLPQGDRDPATPVERVLTTGGVLSGGVSKSPAAAPCGQGACGSGGVCPFAG